MVQAPGALLETTLFSAGSVPLSREDFFPSPQGIFQHRLQWSGTRSAQIPPLPIPPYRRFKVNHTTPTDAIVRRRRQLEIYRNLRAEGRSEKTALRAIGWSRATCFHLAARYRECGAQGWTALSRCAGSDRCEISTLH